MGAKVQCGNYFSGYYSMRDLNEDARSGYWLQCHEDKMRDRGEYCNGFLLRPMVGYSEYDKELLKQTMLKHEAIFKKQVYELHRLYRIQKDLMDDLKKKELSKYSFPVDVPQSSPFSFHMALEDTQKNWQMPSLPMVRSGCCAKPSISVTDKIYSPSNFLKEGSLQVGSVSSENGVGPKECEFLNSRVNKFPRKMFDLQLPADEYIDSEESELVEDEKFPESEVKLTLGMDWGCGLEGNGWKADSRTQHSLYGHKLVDLNEPNQGMCFKEAAASTLVDYPSPLSLHEEIGGTQLSRKPSSQGLPQDFFLNSQKDGDRGTCLNFLPMEHGGSRQEWLSFDLEAGQSRSNGSSSTQGFSHDRGPTSLESLHVGLKQAHNLQFLLPDQRQTDIWLRDKSTCGAEISKASPDLAKSNYVGLLVPPFPGSFPIFHQSDDTKAGTPSVSCWRKSGLNQNPLVVQALPCYNGSVGINVPSKSSNLLTWSPEVPGDKWSLNCNLRSSPSFKNEVSYQNCYNQGLKSDSNTSYAPAPPICIDDLNLNSSDNLGHEHLEDLGPRKFLKVLDCQDVKSVKDMSLSLALPNGFGDKGTPQGMLPNGYGDERTPRIDFGLPNRCGDEGTLRIDFVQTNGEEKFKDRPELTVESFGDPMNFKHNPQMGLGLSQDHLQTTHIRDTGNENFKIELESETGHVPSFAQHFIPTLQTKAEETQKDGASDIPDDRKIPGSPVQDESHSSEDQCDLSLAANSNRDNSKINEKINDPKYNPKNGLLQGDIFGDPKPPFLEKQLDDLVAETGKGLAEQQTQLEVSSKDEADLPSSAPVSSAETDSMNVCLPEDIPHEGVSLEMNQSLAPIQSSECEALDPHEMVSASEVAETIVAMSLGVRDKPSDGVCCSQGTVLKDCLDWFAEVVVSNEGGVEGGKVLGKNGDGEFDVEGLDFFELMTLRLSETKADEYLCKTRAQEEEEKDGGSVLQSQPSRVRLRRGRQRRDFQREILPGIASLSRHEVTKDLQMIGGLMRASGCSWQTGVARRTVGRNDWYFPARGRRHTRCRPGAGAGSLGTASPPQQVVDEELEPEGRRLKGIPWGKTTRRRRMQRFPTGTVCTPLV